MSGFPVVVAGVRQLWPVVSGRREKRRESCARQARSCLDQVSGATVDLKAARSWQGAENQSDRLPAGKILPIRGMGLPHWAGSGNALRFPRLRARPPPGPVQPAPTEASARPGGREAPAGGGAGAGRGLWAPGWPRINIALWQGRWPLPGGARRTQAEEFPALRSGSPCPASPHKLSQAHSKSPEKSGPLRLRMATGKPSPAATVPMVFFFSSVTLALVAVRIWCAIIRLLKGAANSTS